VGPYSSVQEEGPYSSVQEEGPYSSVQEEGPYSSVQEEGPYSSAQEEGCRPSTVAGFPPSAHCCTQDATSAHTGNPPRSSFENTTTPSTVTSNDLRRPGAPSTVAWGTLSRTRRASSS